jgi:serralysin
MGSGNLQSKHFFAGSAAHDKDEHIIYNKASGAPYYDSDGTGSHTQVQFATLANHPSNIGYQDFVLI